jgi:adenine phosphoribosyltransferase
MDAILTERIKSSIRNIPDFPKKGIIFKDLTTLFKDPELMNLLIEDLYKHYLPFKITKVVGIEARGFIVGSALALKLGAGFIPARKPGKLPAATYRKEYSLEYGKDAIEIHLDALSKNDVVLLHDDLLATGGTSKAVFDLISLFGVKDIYVNFITELSFLNGRKLFDTPSRIYSVITFDS